MVVTGASGFIGGYVVQEFLSQGWCVSAFVHRTPLRQSHHLTTVKGDVTDEGSIRHALAEIVRKTRLLPNTIVHCAGHSSDIGRRGYFQRINYDSVRYLGRWVAEHPERRFVFVSTIDVYGLKDFHHEGENQLSFCHKPRNPYPEFKIKAERWLQENLKPHQYSVIRPGNVWGVGDKTLTPRFVSFLRTSPWVIHFGKWRGQNRWPLAHVKNVAAASFIAATRSDSTCNAIHVLDDEKTTMDQFYGLLSAVYFPNKKHRRLFLPFWFGSLFGGVVTGLSHLLRRSHPLMDPSLYALQSISHNLDFDNSCFSKLMSNRGRRLVSREEGFRELMRWAEY